MIKEFLVRGLEMKMQKLIKTEKEVIKKMEYKDRRAGFTLIELSVVIMIILIIAAIAIPRFGDVLDSARQAKCVGNIKNMEQAIIQWENYNNLVYANGWLNKDGTLNGNSTYDLSSYVKDDSVFNCPVANNATHEYYYYRDGYAGTYFPGVNCYYYGRVVDLAGGSSEYSHPHTYYSDDPNA